MFSYGTEQLGQGRDALKLTVQEDPALQKKILDKIYEQVKSGVKPVPAEKEEKE